MLKPRYIEQLPDRMIELYSQLEMDILADMARRISTYDFWIPAAEHQRKVLIEMGNYHSFVMKALSSRTKKTRAELERLMMEAGEKALSFDAEIYQEHGLDPPPLAASKELQAVLRAGLKKTRGLFTNLTRTTANTASKQFENALDRAYMQITSGAFDSNTAIRMAIKDLSKQGIGAISYPSGHVDTIETAVRRAVVTGVNQTALQLQDTLADEMDSDLVETTAHAGARPEHAEWQGKIFSRSGKHPKYPDFRKKTGYGTGAGLGGWNCRHSFFPYFEGSPRAYTEEMLREFEAKKYTYNGQKLTEYEATQTQRHIERQIRRWKRENSAMAAAGLDTGEAAAKIGQWQKEQRGFIAQTGLKRQYDREQVVGHGVEKRSRNDIIKSGSERVTIRNIDSPIERSHTGKGNPNAILHFDSGLTNRQQELLDALPKFDSSVVVAKKKVSMADLSALTASTGDEFALFTNGNERLVIRGDSCSVNVNLDRAEELCRSGYKWSGHTHPGTDFNCLTASQGDYEILQCFSQQYSVIYNSKGEYLIFERMED